MSSYLWPTDDGWPYPDSGPEAEDLNADLDDDLFSLQVRPSHILDGLEPLEQKVIGARFGLGGQPVRSMKQLHVDTGLAREDLRHALGSGLAKLRTTLS
jgi:DNA-directed RNA polymerase sigma subunit (sigma70/sigma32)